MNAIVTGLIATYPLGGVARGYGQYILALQDLGFDVTCLEDSGLTPYDPAARTPKWDRRARRTNDPTILGDREHDRAHAAAARAIAREQFAAERVPGERLERAGLGG